MAPVTKKKPKRSEVVPPPTLRLPPRPKGAEVPRARLFVPSATGKAATRGIELGAQIVAAPILMDLDAAATLTLEVVDPAGDVATLALLDANEDQLLDGVDVRWGTVWWRLSRIDRTDQGWTLTCEDRVAGHLRSHTRPVSASRAQMTRAQFVARLARAVKADGGIRQFIPEINDRQKIQKPDMPEQEAEKAASAARMVARSAAGGAGWGSNASKVTVKRTKADSSQLKVLADMLGEAQRLGCSRRVMMAVVMAVTQESVAGKLRTSSTGAHFGPLHQSRAWGGYPGKGGAAAARDFLTIDKGHGVQGWKVVHGSLKNGNGNLGQMIDKVQIAGTPSAFGQWESEAARTVDLWVESNGEQGTGPSSSSGTQSTTYYRGTYKFRTGAQGGEEPANYWDAMGQLAEEVAWHRWACGNTLGYASDPELIRGTPVVFINPERPHVHDLSWSWDRRREAAELTCTIAVEDTWTLMPGMVAMVTGREAPVLGRWIVQTVEVDQLAGDLARVTLRRVGAKKLEPAPPVRVLEEDDKGTVGGKDEYGEAGDGGGNRVAGSDLVYPLASHGKSLGGVAAHMARAWGNWQSDRAVDIGVPRGVKVFAVADGTVTKLGGRWNGGSGNPDGWNITLRTSGNEWFYTHLQSRASVKVGQRVRAGQYLGRSGAANGVNHLHIACRTGDPEKLLKV